MKAFRAVAELTVATVRLWLRCLVPLLICLLAGHLAFTVLFAASWRLGARDERLGLPVLAVAQLCSLAALVVMFLVAGRRLPGLRRTTPGEGGAAERQEGVLGIVVLTLAPFLAFFALWGLLEPLIADHTWLAVNYEDPDRPGTRTGAASWREYLVIAVVAWLVKSVLVRVNRGRWLVVTAVVAVLEAVWLFLAFWGLTEGAQASAGWFQDRAVWHWITGAWDAAMGWLGRFDLPFSLTVPEILSTLWEWWREVVWPGLKEAVGQPLVWLAITALIFRRRTDPETLAGKVERTVGGLRWDRRVLVDLLTRDYREKYLPLVSAVRLVLRLGLPFLAALCLLYVAIDAAADWIFLGAVIVLDRVMEYPAFLSRVLDLGHQVIREPLQVCLLVVAYQRLTSRTTGSAVRTVTRGRAEAAESSGTSAATVK
jgi:hypothetical protein